MLKGKFVKNYKKVGTDKATGASIRRTIFVYEVSGTEAELAAAIQGIKDQGVEPVFDEESGKLLHFSINYTGDNINMGLTQKGSLYADDSSTSKIQSLVENAGDGVLGRAMATEAAKMILGTALRGDGAASTVAASTEVVTEDDADPGQM